jgi:hypothetical protein
MILARRAAGSGDLAAAAGGRGEIWVARREGRGGGGGGGWELMGCRRGNLVAGAAGENHNGAERQKKRG